MTRYTFPVVIEKDEDGYFAYCPTLQGCYTQGDTYEEALANIRDLKLDEKKINLDGGGSTTMVVREQVVNRLLQRLDRGL